MKLIIQIPCYNEEETLPVTLKDLPKQLPGIDSIEVLVIDDGSSDKTRAAARAHGANHILELGHRSGLAQAFKVGLDKALALGADIIVNTDGDNQYKGSQIGSLIAPIVNDRFDIVVGCRDIRSIEHFSFVKKILQNFGSYIVRKFSNTDIPDVTSGFRAYSRRAALNLNIFSNYTYTLETIIQAGKKGIPMTHIPIEVNGKLRESRLIKSIPAYLVQSIATILRIYLMYEPLKTFTAVGNIFLACGSVFVARFLFAHFMRPKGGHVQSLVLASVVIITGIIIIMIGFLGDVIAANRKLSEEILSKIKEEKFTKKR
ncbi:MAG: glycosyltransferase family 2 protein, partial [Candidatus Omnitrophica bacterium]|nr:glycosyltransferase family 2 protein [Candidatus Omnitrophota bacterium]